MSKSKFGIQMSDNVPYSSHDLNNRQEVHYSDHHLNNGPFNDQTNFDHFNSRLVLIQIPTVYHF